MLKKLLQNKKNILFLLLAIFFLPNALFLPAQVSQIAIVTALGINKIDNQFEVSVQVLSPRFEMGFEENVEIMTVTGNSLENSLTQIGRNLKKEVGLSHLAYVILGTEIIEKESILDLLSPIFNNYAVNKNAEVVYSANIKRALELLNNAGTEKNITEDFLLKKTTLNNLLKTKLKNKTAVLLPILKVEEEQNTLINEGSFLLVKNPVKQTTLSLEQIENLLLLKGENNLNIKIEEQNSSFNIARSRVKHKTSFKNNVPRLYLTVEVTLEKNAQESQEQNNEAVVILAIKKKLAQAFLLLKQNKVDLFSYESLFIAKENKVWKEYLDTLINEQDVLQKLELFATITVKNKGKITLAY